MHLFRAGSNSGPCWTELDDVCESIRQQWNQVYSDNGPVLHAERLPCIPQREAEKVIAHYQPFLDSVRHELAQLAEELCKPYFFAVTDVNGMVLDLFGAHIAMRKLDDCGIGIGTSFALEHAGINAISVAMQLDETAFVRGSEHTVSHLQDWSCICVPVHLHGREYAFIDLSFLEDITPLLAAPLLEESVWVLQNAINCRVS